MLFPKVQAEVEVCLGNFSPNGNKFAKTIFPTIPLLSDSIEMRVVCVWV